MLSVTKQKYIKYFFDQVEGLTITQIAEKYQTSERTVTRGLAWCRKQRFSEVSSGESLRTHIADIKDDIGRIERNIKRLEKDLKDGPSDVRGGYSSYLSLNNSLIGFYRELRSHKVYLAELEGVYKNTLNIQHSGSIKAENPLYDALCSLTESITNHTLESLQGNDTELLEDRQPAAAEGEAE